MPSCRRIRKVSTNQLNQTNEKKEKEKKTTKIEKHENRLYSGKRTQIENCTQFNEFRAARRRRKREFQKVQLCGRKKIDEAQ
uniref:Uncharacterized protein n=1 Tax=Nelumbo nucifera TaxID=4432 RepID=A0A822XV73_NELNU|nr:TPA_asm: hypothetical protein HUJ06_025700 [Nelumbo nucifera]